MAQDLRKLFKGARENEDFSMKMGHETRFLERLDRTLPEVKIKKRSFWGLKIAASILVLISLGIVFFSKEESPIETSIPEVVEKENPATVDGPSGLSLGDLSPDLRKVESYYVANINLELSQLEVSADNKALVDSFMDRLAELNSEYQQLTIELNDVGPNDDTITALIKNLQLRLELLYKLKEKLNEFKSSKNETATTNII